MVEGVAQTASLRCKVQFSGGLEMYFNNNREIQLDCNYEQGA